MNLNPCHRFLLGMALVVIARSTTAQTAVPFIDQRGRTGVFVEGVFHEIEPRAAKTVYPNGDRLFYVSAEGDLRAFVDGRAQRVQRGEPGIAGGSRGQFAWTQGGMLLTFRNGSAEVVCRDVGHFTVHDSLIVFHNRMDRTLCVYWRGRSFPVADLLLDSDLPQWKAGPNTLVFYLRDQRKIVLVYRGETLDLCYGADYALVSPGGDLVAYMDDGDDIFRVYDRGERIDLEDLRPVNFSAGSGLVGYVSGTGKFRCYDGRRVVTLSDVEPSAYFVQDSVITWVEDGQWKTLHDGRAEVIERFVPENWQVSGAYIAYLDLNRELRIYHRGARIQVTKEAGVKRFDLVGDAVVWQSNSGTTKVWWRGKVYERY